MVVLGKLLGELECLATTGAAVKIEDSTWNRRAEAKKWRKLEVGARGTAAGIGAEDEVSEVSDWTSPFGNGLVCCRLSKLRNLYGADLYTSVEGGQVFVDEFWVSTE